MKAVVIPEVNGSWELRDVPDPQPGPGEVLIRIHACGICYNDVLSAQGAIPFPMCNPAIPGHEPVGVIAEVGAGVTSRVVGDRVGVTWVRSGCGRCDYCQRQLPTTGQTAFHCAGGATATGFSVSGGHAEYLVSAAADTVLLPDGISFEHAAPIMCAGYTAWSALRAANPQPRDRIAVVGIGGLGHLAVQFSRACGYETVAVTSSPDKHELARELGADIVVSSGEQLAAAGGADIVLAMMPSFQAATDCLQGLRVNGRLVLSGIDPAAPFVIPPASVYPFFAQRQQIIGSTHNGLQYLKEALDMVAAGLVTPHVETFAADQIGEAVDKVTKGEVRFRAVVNY
ncbi:MAG: alcohol dehydrogenase catalytic domain-containing protein [Jatrophihabitantaceae bacterium]